MIKISSEAIFLFDTAKDQHLFIYDHPYTLEPVHNLVIINKTSNDRWYMFNNGINQGVVVPGYEHLFIQVR